MKKANILATLLIKNKTYEVNIKLDEHTAYIDGGRFGDIKLNKTPLVTATVYNVKTKETVEISSVSGFEKIRYSDDKLYKKFYFENPENITGLTIVLDCYIDDGGLSWEIHVCNDSDEWSVMKVGYPVPEVTAPEYDLFLPYTCGKVVNDAGNARIDDNYNYLGLQITMGYFAAYGTTSGIYLGIEDELAAAKEFIIKSGEGSTSISANFFAINAGNSGNSFSAYGLSRWQYFKGDWYDATMIYADFVKKKAKWLPVINENGRIDTSDKFKDVAYWVSDYIPNNEYQRDNKPLNLSAGSDIYEKNYWYNAVIALQKELNVPIAYHVYNWHHIPFNIEYPHYLPAKDGFKEGLAELKKHEIYVFPYINSVSWEMYDAEGGYETNFENTGKNGAIIDFDGEVNIAHYPQTTRSGKTSRLAPMCPTFPKWHKIIGDVVENMEKDYDIDGVYFDEIAAHTPKPCFNKEHKHLPGGGNYWVEGYNLMMEKINAKKPKDHFYFTEGNAEAYIKDFDGFLCWVWLHNNDVPAFPAIYAGYVEMVGRLFGGKKKEDYDFFKYTLVKSFLYGQQLGWGKADLIYDGKRLNYLKNIVQFRYKFNKFFHSSRLLRPPVITCDKAPKVIPPAIWYTEDIEMEQVLCGAWQERAGKRIVIFVFNISEQDCCFKLTIPFKEYGIEQSQLDVNGFTVNRDKDVIKDKLSAESHKVYEFGINETNK